MIPYVLRMESSLLVNLTDISIPEKIINITEITVIFLNTEKKTLSISEEIASISFLSIGFTTKAINIIEPN